MPEYIIIRDTGSTGVPEQAGAAPAVAPQVEAALTFELEEATLTRAESREIAQDPDVKMVAPAVPLRLIQPVDDDDDQTAEVEGATNTWGIEAVRAHESEFDGEGITVAVLDTGIDADHPAFSGMSIVQDNFTDDVDEDTHGHGTHCAGTIFGQDVNGTRIGVARGIDKALIAKVLGDGGGTSAVLVDAILWAIQEGAHVISMSLGIDFPGLVDHLEEQGMDIQAATSLALEGYRANINLFTELSNLIDQMSNRTVLIAASGNESHRPQFEIAAGPPAAGTGVISVGALRKAGEGFSVARFSNDKVNLAAPGVKVKSARLDGGLKSLNGTSMATPHVAGVAALWAQKQLDATGIVNDEILTAQLIASGTLDPLNEGWEADDVGTGIVQAPI